MFWLVETRTVIKNLRNRSERSTNPDSFTIDDHKIKDKQYSTIYFNEIGPQLSTEIETSKHAFKGFLKELSITSMGTELTSPMEIISIAITIKLAHSSGED